MTSWIVAEFSGPKICLMLAVLAFTAFLGVKLRHSDHQEAAVCKQISSNARGQGCPCLGFSCVFDNFHTLKAFTAKTLTPQPALTQACLLGNGLIHASES